MNKVTQIEVVGDVLVIATEGYLNKDLGEDIQNAAHEHIENGIKKVLINLERSNIVNSIGASILIELIEELQEKEGNWPFAIWQQLSKKHLK